MYTLTVQDEAVYRKLMEKVEQEGSTVDDVLRAFLGDDVLISEPTPEALLRAYNQKIYAQARYHWQKSGNAERAALTDAELDEQFWRFDRDGIPLLKEDNPFTPPSQGTGTLAELADIADRFDLQFNGTNPSPLDYDEVLNVEFGEYLWNRMQAQRQNDNESSPD